MTFVKLLLFFIFTNLFYFTSQVSLTIRVEPGTRECFRHPIEKISELFEVEYQVTEGGDMDIDFFMKDPSGRILISEMRKTDAVHSTKAEQIGDYEFCLDNSFSQFTSKVVYFDVDNDVEDDDTDISNLSETEEIYDMKISAVKTVLEQVKEKLDKSLDIQNHLRINEARDRSIQEDNFTRVNVWSVVHLVIMLAAALVQLILIRSLFDDKSKVSRLFKMRT